MTVIRHAKRRGTTANPWLADTYCPHKPTKLAAVALANKNARIAWALSETMAELIESPWSPRRPERAYENGGVHAFGRSVT